MLKAVDTSSINNFTYAEYENAISELEKVLTDSPANETARVELIILLAKSINNVEIINQCSKGPLSRVESLQCYGRLFTVFFEQKKHLEIEVIVKDILRIDPNNFTANLYLGSFKKENGKISEALNYLSRALQLENGHEVCRTLLGEVLIEKGSIDKAIELYEAGIKLAPGNPDFHCGMGVAYHDRKDYLKAYDSFRKALDINPNHHSIMKFIPTLTAMERYEEAEQLQEDARSRGVVLMDGISGKQLKEGLIDPMEYSAGSSGSAAEQRKWFKTESVNFFPYDDLSRQGELEGLMESCILNDSYFPPEPLFHKNSKLLNFGDCFSGHLTGDMQSHKKNAKSFNISAGLNNTYALYTFVKWCLTGDISSAGYWYDKDDHNKIRQWTPEGEYEHYHNLLQNSDGYVFTVGLSEIWKDLETGGVFWRGVPEDIYDDTRHKLVLSTVEENTVNLGKLCGLIREHCGNKPIIFALSPVSLNATFRPVSCIEADCVSKSTLRVAINSLMSEKRDNVYYWPTFEMTRWLGAHLERPLFGVEGVSKQGGIFNARHVDKKTIEVIAKLFVKHFFHSDK